MKHEPDSSTSQRWTARPPRRFSVATASLTACAHCGTTPEQPPPDPVPPREQQLCRTTVDNGADGSIDVTTLYEYDAEGRLWRDRIDAGGEYTFVFGTDDLSDISFVREHYCDAAGCETLTVSRFPNRRQRSEYTCDELGRHVTENRRSDHPVGTLWTWTYVGTTDHVEVEHWAFSDALPDRWNETRREWSGDCMTREEWVTSPERGRSDSVAECTCTEDRRECVSTGWYRPNSHGRSIEWYDSQGRPTRYERVDAQGEATSWWDYHYNDQGNILRETKATRDGTLGVVDYEYAYLDEGGCPRESADLEGSGSEP